MGHEFNTTPSKLCPLGESSGIHCGGGWVSLGASLEGCEKSRPQLGFETQIFLTVVSCYTD